MANGGGPSGLLDMVFGFGPRGQVGGNEVGAPMGVASSNGVRPLLPSGEIEAYAQSLLAQQREAAAAQAGGAFNSGFFNPTEDMRGVMDPETRGYYEMVGGRAQPRADDPRRVAAEAGISLSDLVRTFGPRPAASGSGNVDYPIASDRGGFFRLSDLYNMGDLPLPSVMSEGASGLSTNNWRLLGGQPGRIMRNGQIIDIGAAASGRGFPAGQTRTGGPSAEHGNVLPMVALGSGAARGFPNMVAPGGGEGLGGMVGWPGSVTPWRPFTSGTYY